MDNTKKQNNSKFIDEYPLLSLPAEMFFEKFPGFLKNNVAPELSVSMNNMDLLGEAGFDRIAEALHEHKVECTIHGPFRELMPGAQDDKIRALTVERIEQALKLTQNFPKKQMVLHHGYWSFTHREIFSKWLDSCTKTLERVLKIAEAQNCTIALENVFEEEPDVLCALMERVKSKSLGVCFDTGHFNLFSKTSSTEWLDALGPYLMEMHIHDNNGKRDQHLSIGEGCINFDEIFSWLSKNNKVSPVYVLEAHKPKQAVMSIKRFKEFKTKYL